MAKQDLPAPYWRAPITTGLAHSTLTGNSLFTGLRAELAALATQHAMPAMV